MEATVTSWKPTRKLIASAITGVAVYALTKLAVDIDPQIEQAINVASMLLAGYFVKNDPAPGGVPA